MATILLIIGTFFWGATFVIVKDAIASIDLYSFLFWRFLISSLFLVPFFIRQLRRFKTREILFGFILGLVLAGGYIFQTIGLKVTTPTKTAFITGISVVIVPVLSSLKYRQIPRMLTIIAVIISGIGIYLMTVQGGISFQSGDLWVLLCAFFFALQIVMVSDMTRHYSAANITIVELFTVAIVSLLSSFLFGTFSMPGTLKLWGAIAFCAVFATAFIFIVQSRFQKQMSDTRAAIIYSFEPLFAALTAFAVYRDALSLRVIIGGALIFIAMLIAGRRIKTKIRQA